MKNPKSNPNLLKSKGKEKSAESKHLSWCDGG